MTVKNRQRIRSRTSDQSTPGAAKTNGVVDAVIFQQSNLTIYLTLQNLLNFFVDRINVLFISSSQQQVIGDEIRRCILLIEEFYTAHQELIGNELRTRLHDFLGDAHSYERQVAAIRTLTNESSSDHAIELASKASHLQWLSVCILQEMKSTFLHG